MGKKNGTKHTEVLIILKINSTAHIINTGNNQDQSYIGTYGHNHGYSLQLIITMDV